MQNVTRIQPGREVLRVRDGRTLKVLQIEEGFLVEKWERGPWQGARARPLDRLAPIFIEDRSFQPARARLFRLGTLLLLAAVVLAFSDYRLQIPLLAPLLTLAGLPMLWLGYGGVRPRSRTRILDELGQEEFAIEHDGVETTQQRKAFEKFLAEAIQNARYEAGY